MTEEGNDPFSQEVQELFYAAAQNRHNRGINKSRHHQDGRKLSEVDTLRLELKLAQAGNLTPEQANLVFRALEGYESLAEYHRFNSPICGLCPGFPEPEYAASDAEDIRRSALHADLLAILAA